ncbi:MAG: cytochrome c3 family protein [bacterium]
MKILFGIVAFLVWVGICVSLDMPKTCTLGKVQLSHSKHITRAGDCAKCHHLGPPEIWSCKKCHSAPITASIPKLKDAYHKKCIDCHKKEKAPTLCTTCHTWKTQDVSFAFLPEVCTIGSVSFSHSKHTKLSNCQRCHHTGDVTKCTECHQDSTLNKPGKKGAFHRLCILCHKETKGPVSCKECHKNR